MSSHTGGVGGTNPSILLTLPGVSSAAQGLTGLLWEQHLTFLNNRLSGLSHRNHQPWKTKLANMENRLVVARGTGLWGEGQEKQVKGVKRYILPVIKPTGHGDIRHSVVAIVNNTALRI